MKLSPELEKLFPDGLVGIIFDCDGVMIDSEAANRHYYNSILAYLGHPPMTEKEEAYAFMATSMEALLRMTPPEDHARLGDAVHKAIDYERDILPRIKLMPGFVEFVRHASTAGLRLGIDTNRTELGINRVLDFFGLPHYFNPVISASLAAPKPSPDGARLICKDWGCAPGQVMFVGDSENDGMAARGAGAIFAAFHHKGLKGDIIAPDYASLQTRLWPGGA